MACGFFLGIDQEKALGSLSVKGVVFGVLSSIFIALTGIYTKTALDVVNKDEVCISRFLHHVSKSDRTTQLITIILSNQNHF